MRKLLIAILLLAALLLPGSARAQTEIVLEKLDIQLWPEYDQPSVLAIVEFALPADTTFPVKISLRVPANATLSAVARDANGLITVPYETGNTEGDWRTIALSVAGPEAYRLEYYYSFAKSGSTRSFSFTWPGDYAVKNFSVEFQEPTKMKNLRTDPALSDPFPSSNGMLLHRATATALAAGEPYTLNVQYDRSTDEMSAASLEVNPSGGDLTPQQNLSLTTLLPLVLGGLGLLLIVGGGIWYWQSGRGVEDKPRPRRRHAAKVNPDDEDQDDDDDAEAQAVYCHQCGRRASPGDKFCRACGTRLRLEG